MAEAEGKSKSAFSEAEKAAMRERAKEAREFKKLSGDEQVRLKLQEMSPEDRKLAEAIHKAVLEVSSELSTRTWYGMPAYYKGKDLICFFQAGSKFESRYSTFGFQDGAKLDDGAFWPTSFAVLEATDKVLADIQRMVKKAIS